MLCPLFTQYSTWSHSFLIVHHLPSFHSFPPCLLPCFLLPLSFSLFSFFFYLSFIFPSPFLLSLAPPCLVLSPPSLSCPTLTLLYVVFFPLFPVPFSPLPPTFPHPFTSQLPSCPTFNTLCQSTFKYFYIFAHSPFDVSHSLFASCAYCTSPPQLNTFHHWFQAHILLYHSIHQISLVHNFLVWQVHSIPAYQCLLPYLPRFQFIITGSSPESQRGTTSWSPCAWCLPGHG